MVRAKFTVGSITRSLTNRSCPKTEENPSGWESVEIQTIKMSPVYGNNDPNHENTKFWNSSPSGSLELGCVNAEAVKQFEIGKEFYVDFTAADEGE